MLGSLVLTVQKEKTRCWEAGIGSSERKKLDAGKLAIDSSEKKLDAGRLRIGSSESKNLKE
jgi:hypothetical protein